MPSQLLQYADHAPGLPYHAALVVQSGRSEQHGHADFYEFMGVASGQGRQLLVDGAQQLHAGDVVLVRPRDRHAMQGFAAGGLTFVNVAFPAALWRGFVGLSGLDPSGSWESAALPPHWRLAGRGAERAAAVFQRALTRYQHRPTMLDALRFWTDLTELLGDPAEPAVGVRATGRPRNARGGAGVGAGQGVSASGRRPDWLARACTAMRQEENLRGGVPRMLRLAAVSAAHLSRTVRTYYGITPTAFVTELRLQRATELLSATTDPVTAIAQRCGFSSQSYFTRCFRAAHGIPPREYRQRAWRAFVP
ncbi:helix-turn-helix transcriptional regulator [Streptomyces odontomachi]|uniref:helix-turn-helix transcriptional regulator n=1 Tax=Streptomyces odontomachi TaxID=2944940 RepID=UPI00210C40D9|nr:AraC family transcriptional regulator [Streptomyces sp. ODS25]